MYRLPCTSIVLGIKNAVIDKTDVLLSVPHGAHVIVEEMKKKIHKTVKIIMQEVEYRLEE